MINCGKNIFEMEISLHFLTQLDCFNENVTSGITLIYGNFIEHCIFMSDLQELVFR